MSATTRTIVVSSAQLYAAGCRSDLLLSPSEEWEVDRRLWLAHRPGRQVSVPIPMQLVIEAHDGVEAGEGK